MKKHMSLLAPLALIAVFSASAGVPAVGDQCSASVTYLKGKVCEGMSVPAARHDLKCPALYDLAQLNLTYENMGDSKGTLFVDAQDQEMIKHGEQATVALENDGGVEKPIKIVSANLLKPELVTMQIVKSDLEWVLMGHCSVK